MAEEPLAKLGNFLFVYDFHVKPGTGDEFIVKFNEADYSPNNPMHASPHQVKDGVLTRDVDDPNHFWLIGEWSSIEAHKKIRADNAKQPKTDRSFVDLVVDGKFSPLYGEVVSATPLEILQQAKK